MDSRCKRGLSKNEGVYRDTTNAYGPNQRALQGAELKYLELEKLILALVYAARRLRRYFQAHSIRVLTDKPIKQILARPEKSRRVAKWVIELAEHDIEFKGRNSVKGQVLADFLAEMPSVEGEDKETKKHQTPNEESKPEDMWKLYTDKASSSDGSGVSLMLVSPEERSTPTLIDSNLRPQTTKQNKKCC
ncbi:reverse transcriptase domain-containing protein [Tanacetum coccineum]